MKFKNKNILITGASKGLGMIAAQKYAAEGATLALVARSKDLLESLRSSLPNANQHKCFVVDFTKPDTIENFAKEALQFFKNKIDVVVHCAGGGLGIKSSLLSYADLLTLFQVNLASAIEINRIIIPEMQKQKSGSVLHIGSIASYEGVGSVGYNTVKASISAYVRSMGREMAKSGVIVSGIHPGGFTAPKNSMDRMKTDNPTAYNEFIQTRLPRGEMAQADDLIPMLFLLSSAEAKMFCGCMVPMDAGESKVYI